MKSKDTRFLISLLLFVIALTGLTMMLKNYSPQYVTPYWGLLILFFATVNVTVYFLSMKVSAKKDMSGFANFHIGTTVVKLIIYLAILLTYILIFPEDKKAFVISFLAYYLCFTFFETYFLVKNKN